jgi:hypothetical protein
MFPWNGYRLTLAPGEKKTVEFLVIFWPCRTTSSSPAADFTVRADVHAPGDTKADNDWLEATVKVLKPCGHWCWCRW